MDGCDRISIIVPVYNTEKYLTRCVESLRAQTYTNLEILLVDDGSTDESGRLCDRFAAQDDRIRVLHKENGGSSSARNLGLSAARGEYIGFVDSDDYVDADMYEKLYTALRDGQVNAAQIGRDEIAPDGKVLPDICIPPKEPELILPEQFMEELLMHRGDCSFCTKLIRADIFRNLADASGASSTPNVHKRGGATQKETDAQEKGGATQKETDAQEEGGATQKETDAQEKGGATQKETDAQKKGGTIKKETDAQERGGTIKKETDAQEKGGTIKKETDAQERGGTAQKEADDAEYFPEGVLNEDFHLLVRLLDQLGGVVSLPGHAYHVFYRLGSNSRKEDREHFSRVYADSVDNADMVAKIVAEKYPGLQEIAFRFGVFQRLEYMLHIPIAQMTKQNEQYRKVVAYLRRSWGKAMRNSVLTKKNKVYHTLFAVAPKAVRKLHRRLRKPGGGQ